MAELRLESVGKTYGRVSVIRDLSLTVADGEFVSFVGPSGCGKSTLLRMICGIEEVSAGRIVIDGDEANYLTPKARGVAMVFQSYALYPHMTVRQNIGYALKLAKMPREQAAEQVAKAARILQIEPLLDRYPRQLSGGQRQRVAIGRAITRQPKLFLFDEPLSNLDAALRVEMRAEIARLASALKTTIIYVTHDQTEAMTLSDRIVVLKDGEIQQIAAPLELYHNPANSFVAAFIGSPRINLIPGRIAPDGRFHLAEEAGGAELTVPGVGPGEEASELGIRPEDLTPTDADAHLLAGRVAIVEKLGSDSFVHLDTPASPKPVIVRVDSDTALTQGETIRLVADPARVHLFAADGRRVSPAHPATSR